MGRETREGGEMGGRKMGVLVTCGFSPRSQAEGELLLWPRVAKAVGGGRIRLKMVLKSMGRPG